MASEAEHVGPLAQAQVGVLGLGSEVPGGVDHLAGVVGEVVLGEFGEEAQAAVEGAGGGLGSLGGVLGDVGGDVPVGDGGVAGEVGAADRADVDLPPEPEHRGLRRLRGPGLPCPGAVLVTDAGTLGGGAHGVVEKVDGGPGRRGAAGAGGAVDADDGVEVDLAALLVLGGLGVRQGRVVAQGAMRQTSRMRDLAAQMGGEAGP